MGGFGKNTLGRLLPFWQETGMAGRLVLAGGSGFLGRVLAAHFAAAGWEVVVLGRRAGTPGGARWVQWDARALGPWASELEGAAAVVNLAGRSVNCRYDAGNRAAILHSRVESTRVLGRAIAACEAPPPVWLNSSTATIYRHSLDRPMDEATGEIGATPAAKDAFSVEVAQAWEAALAETETPGVRKVALRTAMVLGLDPNSVYPTLLRLARLGLGGPLAGGRQYVSWIHAADFCRAIEWLIERPELSGPVNVAAPSPVTNAELMRRFRAAAGTPFGLPASRWMLELGAWALGTETELVLKSRRVVPRRLLESGFEFRFPLLQAALDDLRQP
jgi:uncharacterized protein (TIGR01777 family)